ncbi:ATP-binding protein [Desulfocastanea catecholica]
MIAPQPQARFRDESSGDRTGYIERDRQRERVIAAMNGEFLELPAGRLTDLAYLFGLSPLDVDTLAVLWVGAFDPELRLQLAKREVFCGQITARLIANLFGHSPRVLLMSESPLLLWKMVQEHPFVDGGAALTLDPAILAWLEGDHELNRALAGRVQLLAKGHESSQWAVTQLAEKVQHGLQRGQRWRVQLVTDDMLAASWFAAALGGRVSLPVLHVRAGELSDEANSAVYLHRQAFLDSCIPCVFISDAALTRPTGVLAYPVQIVLGKGTLPPASDVQDVEYILPLPDIDEREALWRALWPESAAWSAHELADLALCHEASVSDIAEAARSAPSSAAQAALSLREQARGDLGPLVRRIDSPFLWSDLVLSEPVHQRLQEIVFEARERTRVWADPSAARLFPYGRGLVALFAGAPGTGKTMAAQVIAADLGLDLLAVDLSAVVSKWVGETAQHLQKILSSRASQRAILLFDEADALYAKRVAEVRDAQDRFANVDTSHLMTALEAYPGIVLLASNLKGNIDSAFLRRIRHVVDFPKPDGTARERIWNLAVEALFGASEAQRLAPDLQRIASIEATGALIKSAALSSLFAARRTDRPPDVILFGEMLARELAKEGVGLSARELEDVLGDGP